MEYRLEGSDVVILAVAVWFVGTFINNRVAFLRRYSIPVARRLPRWQKKSGAFHFESTKTHESGTFTSVTVTFFATWVAGVRRVC